MRHLYIAFIFLTQTSLCQTNNFLKFFDTVPGYAVFQQPYSAVDTLSSNSFITAGFKMRWGNNSNDTLLFDSYIQKTEISGLTKWFRLFHLNGYDLTFKDVKVGQNKDILCAGQTNDYFTPDPSVKHGILMKTDSNGIVQWCRFYPRQKIYKLLKRSDNTICVLASDSGGYTAKYLKLALLNPAGNLLWCKRVISADTNWLTGFNIVEGANKSILVAADFNRLILFDSSGNFVNALKFSGPAQAFYRAIKTNTGFYLTGCNLLNNKLVSSLAKTDESLNLLWYKCYQSLNGDSEFHNILRLAPNNFLVFCEPENYGVGVNNKQRFGFAFFDSSGVCKKSHLISTDSAGIIPAEFIKLRNDKILFTAFQQAPQVQFFGITDTASNYFCKYTSITWNNVSAQAPAIDNSFTTTNGTFNYSLVSVYAYQPFDLTINYSCSSGPVGPLDPTGVTESGLDDNLQLFPSPTSDFVYIRNTGEKTKAKIVNYHLCNSFGSSLSYKANLQEQFVLDLRTYPAGLYYLLCTFDNGRTLTKKIIVLTKDK